MTKKNTRYSTEWPPDEQFVSHCSGGGLLVVSYRIASGGAIAGGYFSMAANRNTSGNFLVDTTEITHFDLLPTHNKRIASPGNASS
ncbi:hypothetical protein [Fibrella arboris]|uniref:hypothetical protein n=1 Tax=Fibrella arboris TaxID=3242486 RepID=UPI0035212666